MGQMNNVKRTAKSRSFFARKSDQPRCYYQKNNPLIALKNMRDFLSGCVENSERTTGGN